MFNLRITNGYDGISDAKLITKATNIWTAMTASPYFTTPVPALADLKDTIDAFATAVSEAETGNNYQKAVKNQIGEQLIEMLHSLGNYVLFTANGDFIVAQSSGFSIAKTPSPRPPVGAPASQKLEDGASAGELQFSFETVKGARGYAYQYTQDPITENSAWQTVVGTSRKVVFAGLEVGKKYWCRVIVIGSRGQGVTSNAISRVVQ
jgi:hypothetical protein